MCVCVCVGTDVLSLDELDAPLIDTVLEPGQVPTEKDFFIDTHTQTHKRTNTHTHTHAHTHTHMHVCVCVCRHGRPLAR